MIGPLFEENDDGTLTGPLGTTWVPEDSDHPLRPDLPILRHFTFREAHGVELGLWLGLAFGLFLRLGEFGAAVALIGFVRRGLAGTATMPKQVRALFRDAWYILVASAVGAPIGYYLGGFV